MLTRAVVFHFASGHAFFSGTGLILAALVLSCFAPSTWKRRCRNWSVTVGAMLVTLSATPLAIAAWFALAGVSLAWLISEWSPRSTVRWRKVSRAAAAIAWTTTLLVELPFHFQPRIERMERPVLGIIGDSITAGLGENEAVIWPRILAETRRITVRDHSAMGATVASAMQQGAALADDETLVVLEIGGNDLLGGASADVFERGLQTLLNKICRPGRVVVMFELPLPPTYNSYGLAQRRVARTHGVQLIPKRVLLGLLNSEGATLDSIHLSPSGHRRMAEIVWNAIHAAFE